MVQQSIETSQQAVEGTRANREHFDTELRALRAVQSDTHHTLTDHVAQVATEFRVVRSEIVTVGAKTDGITDGISKGFKVVAGAIVLGTMILPALMPWFEHMGERLLQVLQ